MSRPRPTGAARAACLAALVVRAAIASAEATDPPGAPKGPTGPPAMERLQGVSWTGGGIVGESDLAPLVRHHVNWISQTPFGWQRGLATPAVEMATGGHVYWGETDAGIIATARMARGLGIRTLLKPQIWVTGAGRGAWSGDIRMASEADWSRWFASYRTFILHYAELAEANGIEALCIGAELRGTLAGHETAWRRLIAEVRSVYRGRLTYGANWHKEFEEVPFWDALDLIGIQAYFPLADVERPAIDRLRRGWAPHLEAIARLQSRHGKPVAFTEMGYRSAPDAAIEPWKWPRRDGGAPRADLETQAACYEAFFETFWGKEWFAGVFVWKWYPRADRGGPGDEDFTPQNKPAAQVMDLWYGGRPGP